jgi:hypothetical protein
LIEVSQSLLDVATFWNGFAGGMSPVAPAFVLRRQRVMTTDEPSMRSLCIPP